MAEPDDVLITVEAIMIERAAEAAKAKAKAKTPTTGRRSRRGRRP